MKVQNYGLAILAIVLSWLVFLLVALTLAFPPEDKSCDVSTAQTETGIVYSCEDDE